MCSRCSRPRALELNAVGVGEGLKTTGTSFAVIFSMTDPDLSKYGMEILPAHVRCFVSRKLLIVVVALAMVVAFVGGSVVLIRCVQRPPFVLRITPTASGAIVEVRCDTREGGKLVSPRFDVPGHYSESCEVVLSSRHVVIPGGNVKFADATILPGRFTIQLGTVELDVMESQILVDGVSHNWESRD